MLITISGPPGSGKSTVAAAVAETFGLEHVSGGDVFRGLAEERGLSLAEFNELAETDDSIDHDLDRRLRDTARDRDDVVLESRLSGWMAGQHADLRVWLDAPIDVRAARIADREGSTVEAAREETRTREDRHRRGRDPAVRPRYRRGRGPGRGRLRVLMTLRDPPGERSIESLLGFGVVNLDKPPGPTSHQVSAWVRDLAGLDRAGHAGTLDPQATGLLIVLVARPATRLQEAFMHLPKTYEGTIRFGERTPSLDALARPIRFRSLPSAPLHRRRKACLSRSKASLRSTTSSRSERSVGVVTSTERPKRVPVTWPLATYSGSTTMRKELPKASAMRARPRTMTRMSSPVSDQM